MCLSLANRKAKCFTCSARQKKTQPRIIGYKYQQRWVYVNFRCNPGRSYDHMLGYGGSVVGWQRGLLHTDSLLNIHYIISMTKIVTIEQCYFHRHVITIIIYEHIGFIYGVSRSSQKLALKLKQ